MGLITVVRHGQASTFGKQYDLLTELGQEQSRLLGEYWADRGIEWDRVLVGPRLRHRATEEAVSATYRARGLPWPDAETIDGLDEINMTRVASYLAGKGLTSEESMDLHEVPEHERPQALKASFVRMQQLTRDFAAGHITAPDAESWDEFKARGQLTLDVLASSGKGKRVLAFRSGGLTGMLVGCVLDLSDEKTIDLMMQIRNGSYTSFMYSPGRCSLTSFNSVPHLRPDMWTIG
jgi:broad specificity phosphatase PhoE